ncbi:carbohydrate binding [Sparganum proliferum]
MGLLYSVDPHLNGLWVRMPCSLRGHVQAICQASPTRFADTAAVPAASPTHAPHTNNNQTDLFTCPVGFKLGLYNTTSAFNAETGGGRGSVSRLPACHRLASEKPMPRENAQKLCESQSAHLPSIESVSDLNYFRAWLQSPLSLGGAGLTPTDAVWLGLQVPECPDCWRAWSWDSVGQSVARRPVRITDWYEAPSDPSGCYVFNVSSHHPDDVNFESMQPAKCDSAFPVVCQTVASPALSTPSSPTAESVLIEPRLADPPSCAASANAYVRTDIHVAKSGNACVRWDLVSNFEENVKQPALESDVSSVFGAHFSWFGGNSCAYVFAPFGNDSLDAGNASTPQFVCFTSRDHTSLEACQVVTCVPEEYGLSSTSSLGLIVGFFLLSLLFLTLMGLLIYRFGYRSYNRGYRRQRPVPFTLSGNLPGGESVFGLPTYRRSFFHSLAPVRIFDASNASMLTPAPSAATTFKNPLYRPLFDASLEEPDNVEEFSSPHV